MDGQSFFRLSLFGLLVTVCFQNCQQKNFKIDPFSNSPTEAPPSAPIVARSDIVFTRTPDGHPRDSGNCCADIAWSNDNWILSVVPVSCEGGAGFKLRIEKFRPVLGGERVIVNDGGPNCTPVGMEQSGDADPAFSPDGKTIYSSRGFPNFAKGTNFTERRLFSFSSDAWQLGKNGKDLGLPSNPSCVEGVPKVSPDGKYILLFRHCSNESNTGIFLTDTTGSFRKFIVSGFGPDWNTVSN